MTIYVCLFIFIKLVSSTGGILFINIWLVLVLGKKTVLRIMKYFLPFLKAGPKSKLCHDLIHYLVIFNALALTEKQVQTSQITAE